MPATILKKFLDDKQVKYVCISHSLAFTAQEIAELAHISGKKMAKTVMVKKNGSLVQLVLPANLHVNFSVLKQQWDNCELDLATELDFKDQFPGCEVGAMPPFGNLYDLEVYVHPALVNDENIVFNAGTHLELIQLGYEDFNALVKPSVVQMD